MTDAITPLRRLLLTAAAIAPLGAGGGTHAQPVASMRPFGALKQATAGPLSKGYVELGPEAGPAVILLHGWPYDIHSFVEVGPALAAAGDRVVIPHLRGHGTARCLSPRAPRNAQQAALAWDIVKLMDAIGIDRAIIAGFDWGARSANIVAAIWPERCRALVSVSGYLIGNRALGQAPLAPRAELQWGYQFYFATERGARSYAENRSEFARLIWQLASPEWRFDEATFQRSAASLENPDHVAIVIHNYRWRLGLAEDDPALDPVEAQLAQAPVINVPTITLEGDANGAPHPEPAAYARKFVGPYAHRLITGGIGHNLPQEAPQAFVTAILDLARG